jgi:hypothetical protein
MNADELIAEVRTLDGVTVHVRYHVGGRVVKSSWPGTLLNCVVIPTTTFEAGPSDAWYEECRKEREREIQAAFDRGTRLFNIDHQGEIYEYAVPVIAETVSTHLSDGVPSVSARIKGDWVELEPIRVEPAVYTAASGPLPSGR